MPGWHTTSRHERGYGYQWQKLRQVILRRDNYLCQPCLSNGRPTPATEVDHITPKAKGGDDGQDNLQSICRSCHAAKTKAEADEAQAALRKEGKRYIGADGWPVEPKRWGFSIPNGMRSSAIPVTVVCGPPASGKTTYVNDNAGKRDKVICLDTILAKIGAQPRAATPAEVKRALRYRDMMIRSLADEPGGKAWLITTGGTPDERAAWIDALGSKATLQIMDTAKEECIARIKADETREPSADRQIEVVKAWS